VRVKGDPFSMNLPKAEAIGKYALPSIKDEDLFNRKPFELHFKADAPDFTVNGQSFDRDRIDLCPRLTTAEEWMLVSDLDNHPFHIHVNPFEVIQKNEKGEVIGRVWKDTIFFTKDDPAPTYIRLRFEDYPGKTVLHCHNLAHEDQGMMMAINLVGKATLPSRCDPPKPGGLSALPMPAPSWSLRDAEKNPHSTQDFNGQNYILIFYRGLACSHCRRQLEALANHQRRIEDAKLKIVEFMRDELPQWSLTLSKDGYQDETLDISPKQKPESPRRTTQLRAHGRLLPK